MKAIETLIAQKQKALARYADNKPAMLAIQNEIRMLQEIKNELYNQEDAINRLIDENQKLEDAKTILEIVCAIHGIPLFMIQHYYNDQQLDGVLKLYEELQAENQIIIPTYLKKYLNGNQN